MTDSNSQIPADLADRYDIKVVPITVIIDGKEYREGVDLDADSFWDLWTNRQPEVMTSQPSPGAFLQVYEELIGAGFDEILSVHIGATYSGTLNSARLAAERVDVPVRMVDTNTVSFGITCCVWEAAEARLQGCPLEEAARRAEQIVPTLGSVTVLQALDVARAMGRMPNTDTAGEGVPVIAMTNGEVDIVGHGRTVDELARTMVDTMTSSGDRVRVALCIADASARPFYEVMERDLVARPNVAEIVRYRLGPSVGAFTGPGAAGGFWYPIPEVPD
ncbi:MAG: DegV family protein [Acidimicrobiales bacterium]